MKIIAKLNDENVLGQPGMSDAIPRIAARGIIRDSRGLYALMFLRKFGLYSLPGGGHEDGETLEETLMREMLEEVGCVCENIREVGIVEENRFCHDYTQINNYYAADAASVSTTNFTEEEKRRGTELQWHTFDELYRLIDAENDIATDQRKYIRARDLAALEEYKKMMR